MIEEKTGILYEMIKSDQPYDALKRYYESYRIVVTSASDTLIGLAILLNDKKLFDSAIVDFRDDLLRTNYEINGSFLQYIVTTKLSVEDKIIYIKSCLDTGLDINFLSDPEDFTPLHEAAWRKDRKLMNALIELGADPNIRSQMHQNQNPEEMYAQASPPSPIEVENVENLEKLMNKLKTAMAKLQSRPKKLNSFITNSHKNNPFDQKNP